MVTPRRDLNDVRLFYPALCKGICVNKAIVSPRHLIRSLQRNFQFNLIPQRNAILANHGNTRFDLPGFVHRAPPEGCQFEAALLIKPERMKVIVGCAQKQTAA